jgi:hypothetical protein
MRMISFDEDSWNGPFVIDIETVTAINVRHQRDEKGDIRCNIEFILSNGYSKVWKWQLIGEANQKIVEAFRGQVQKMVISDETTLMGWKWWNS